MRLSVLFVTMMSAAGPAWAQLAYDPAGGPIGPVHGVASGTNFGPWQSQNGDLTSYAFGAGLYFPWLQTEGNAVYGGRQYQSAGVPVTTSASAFDSHRNGSSLGADGTILWASALINNFTGYDGASFSLHNDGTAWAQGSGVRVVSQGGYWRLSDGSQTVSTGVKVDPGVTTLMVLKNQYTAAGDTTTLYINPTPGQPLTQTGTSISNTNLNFRAARFYPGNSTLQGAIDELRIGSTYESVTPYDATATPQLAPQRIRTFFIGNSVTDTINPEALRRTALASGQFMPWSRHVNLGSPLDNTIATGAGFTEAPYGAFSNALPNYTWESVSIQPFDRQLASDRVSVQTLINKTLENPNNSQTEFLIYSRWPRRESDGSLDYQARWLQDYNPAGGAWLQEESQDYFQTLTDTMRADNPGKTIRLVPVGDVLNKIDLMMEAGEFGSAFDDIIDVYSDGIHFNNHGSFIVGMTYYATLFKTSPEGLPLGEYGLTAADAAYAALVQEAVWDVVESHPYTMVPEPTMTMLVPVGVGILALRRRSERRK